MKIGELAKRAGVAASAIRFYESSGLLAPALRGGNGYRLYDDDALERLQVIQLAQRLGMSLEDLRAVFVQWDGEQVVELIAQQLQSRLREIDRMQQTLQTQRAEVELLLIALAQHQPGEVCPVLATVTPPGRGTEIKGSQQLSR